MMLNLAAPSKEASKLFKKLNIEVTDGKGNMLDAVTALESVRVGLQGMGTAEKAAALDTIFKKRAIAGATKILDESTVSLTAFRNSLKQSGDYSVETANKIRQSMGNRLKILKSTLIDAGFKFVEVFQKEFPNAIDETVKWIRKVDVKSIVKSVQSFLKTTKEIFNFIRSNMWIIKGFIDAWILYKGVMITMKVLSVVDYIKDIIVAQQAATVATSANTTAQLANNAARQAGNKIAMTKIPVGANAQTAGGVAVAGAMGYAAGSFLSKTFIDPADKKKREKVWGAQDTIRNVKEKIRLGKADKGSMIELERARAQLKTGIGSFENGIGNIAAVFTDGKMPINQYFEDVKTINKMQQDIINQMAISRAQIAQQNSNQNIAFEGNITVNAPKGTTVSSSTKGAKPINMELAGQN